MEKETRMLILPSFFFFFYNKNRLELIFVAGRILMYESFLAKCVVLLKRKKKKEYRGKMHEREKGEGRKGTKRKIRFPRGGLLKKSLIIESTGSCVCACSDRYGRILPLLFA